MAIRDLQGHFQSEMMRLNATTHQYNYQIRLREHELTNRRFQIRLVIISGGFLVLGFTVFYVLLFRKNQRLKELLGRVREQNHIISAQHTELATLNAEKDRLFSIIAHDLRSPFNTISGFSEIIYHESGSINTDDIRQYAGLIHTTAERTLHLLESLLHWARVQVGSINYQPGMHQLHHLVEVGTTPLLTTARKKSIELRNQVSEEIYLWCDEKMIVTVIRNLVSNGVKFSHPGGKVAVSAENGDQQVIINVSDNGVGIPAKNIDTLFSLDTGFSTPGTDGELGTGFGLVLSNTLVKKHEGHIEVKSTEGKGSVFSVFLPARTEKSG